MSELDFPPLKELINEAFIPSWHYKGRYQIEWGGRGSSKSVYAAKKLIVRCLSEPYFRFVLFRNVFETIRDSQWQTIKDIVEEWGLQDLFRFTKSPLEIVCVNGNKFIARGGDKTSKIKSLKDPTGVWYEEDIPEEESFYDISGSIRTTKAEYLQEVFTMNPEVDGHYEDNWFYQRFFGNHPGEHSFHDVTKVIIDNEPVKLSYMCHHSTYKDNRFLPAEYKAQLEQYRFTNEYKYTVHTLGEWGTKEIKDKFWKNFQLSKHVDTFGVDLDSPLHISFDENTRPYPALSIWQVDNGKEVYQVHEICLRTPRNKLTEVCREFIRWCDSIGWSNVVFLYGDASSDKEDAKLQKGQNYWTMMRDRIEEKFTVRMKKPSKNPPIALSAEFINDIYARNIFGISILISDSCRESINDYQFAEESGDGTMRKPKKDGVELIGHLSDTKRYILTKLFENEFREYQKGKFDPKNNYKLGNSVTDRSF
jgi:PBSX family phage terminase large subunit